jgi:hypothetical protein
LIQEGRDAELARIKEKSAETRIETLNHAQQVDNAVCIATDDPRLAK